MNSLPSTARNYVAFVCLVGILAAAGAAVLESPKAQGALWEQGLFLVLGVLAGSTKVRLMRTRSAEDVWSMSLGFALTFAALLRCGPAFAAVIAASVTVFRCLSLRQRGVYDLLFPVALTIAVTWLSGHLFLLLNGGGFALKPLRSFLAAGATTAVFVGIDTGAVAALNAFCRNQDAAALWKKTFAWTLAGYLAAAGVITLINLLFGRAVGPALLFVFPMAYLTYQSYCIHTARAAEKQQHIEELQVSQAHLADLYLNTIKSLALAIDAKDQYTHQHILRVQRYAVATAERMGLTGADLEGVNTGALLHDIGKLGVPEYVLLKPGRLTDEEFAKIKKHPEIGAAILDPVEFPWPVLPAVKYHHEKWDGNGYPEGLKGEDIPLTARILAVADVYDALTSSRSYRNAWSHEKALGVIKQDAGTHFDPAVVEHFLQVIGSIVEEMAQEGYGPLIVEPAASKNATSKADQAALDIHRASSELWALYEVAQTLSSSLGLQETIDILARKLEAILPGTACLFLLKEERTDVLVARAARGVNREFFEGCHTLDEESISLQVARQRETYLGPYVPDDLLLTGSQTVQWVALRSALIVPIVHQGEFLGTINLYHPQPDAFSFHDRQLLETIAERAAMALYNGLLFDRTRSHAFTDPLTGLYNVRYLTQYVEERCQKVALQGDGRSGEAPGEGDADTVVRRRDGFALLCLDLDSFKPINDNFGHQKGDQVLCDLGKIFKETVRKTDVVARYGGDEFLIVLEGASPAEAAAMTERLGAAVEGYDPCLVHAKLGALRLGVSIGYACFPHDGADCATLLSAADSQMYRGKTERKLGHLAGSGRPRQSSAEPGDAPDLRMAA